MNSILIFYLMSNMIFLNFRKALLVFPEDTKEYIESEIANYTDMEVKVLGTCCVKLNKQKATLLVNKRRKLKEGENEDELLMEMSSKFHFISFHLLHITRSNQNKSEDFVIRVISCFGGSFCHFASQRRSTN